ncbi:hypothetical protein Gohar_013841, partial [Gossypium harknessii]|nr:hypothetical protein [Gossypium harknessii]
MWNSLANLWPPLRGIEISDSREKRFLFRFFHRVDIEIVIKGAPWTSNNHLLIFHGLQEMEDPMLVPLFYSYIWVQVHDLPRNFIQKQWRCNGRILLVSLKSMMQSRLCTDVDGMEMEWDISLRAPPLERTDISKSIWLKNSRLNAPGLDEGCNINWVLGVNLGDPMVYDLEDDPMEVVEEKK